MRTLLTAPVVVDGNANPNEDLAYPGTVATLGSDADGNQLTYSIVTPPNHGTLTMNAAGTFTYTPNADFSGADQFEFMANDGTDDSEAGTFFLNVNPVDDGLKLTMPSATTQVARNSTPVRIDPAATIADVDTAVNYANTQIRAVITAGNSNGDHQKGRVILTVQNQTSGAYTVEVIGSKIFYNGTRVGSYTGGIFGRALVVKFNTDATEAAVNAVMKQISMQASKKASSFVTTSGANSGIGIRLVNVTVSAGGQKASAVKVLSVI